MALIHYQFAVLFVVIGFSFGTLSRNEGSLKTIGECNFDAKSFCGWKQPSISDNFDWTLNQGKTPSYDTGPSNDRSGKGYYAYIETSSPRREGDKARLQSGPYSGVYCLHFSYSMIGASIARLSVLSKGIGEESVWSKKGQQLPRTREWNSDNVTVYGINYYIVFEATVGDNYLGDIAIDDLYLVNGSCHGESIVFGNDTEDGKCSFDLGLCDWSNDLVASEYPWYLSSYRGKQSPKSSRPDHGGKLGGKFVYAVKRRGQSRGTKSRLVSRPLCGPKCVEFFYVMERTTNSEFRMFVRDEGEEDRLWFVNGKSAQTKDWKRGLVEVVRADASKCYQLIFEADISGLQSPLVGLDDILIANGSCCPLIGAPENVAKANCDFEDDTFCNWHHSPTTNFLWSIGQGKTPSGLTGPTTDFSGNGKYAYIEASEPQYVGDTAVLISDMLAGQQCMRFKYHMYGDDIGTLSIYRQDSLFWEEEGNHGNQWVETSVDFDCSVPKYQIKIKATVGGWKGDIAIDELQFTPGACPVKVYSNSRTTTAPATTLPTLPPLPPPTGTCNFLLNFCDWSNTYTDDGDWIRHKSETPSYHTGPHFDRDGDGYYIYMEATDLLPGQQIRLESREISGPICLTFYYHMFGKDIGELKIEQRNLTDNSTNVAWFKSGEEEDFWDFALQAFYGERYKLTFVGVRGKGFRGDIALDEIGIVGEHECRVSHGPYAMGGDVKSDPAQANCDFEDDIVPMCKWANDGFDEFNWVLSSKHNWRGTPSAGTGPRYDHTYGAAKPGRLIYIEASNPRRPNDQAYLLVKVEGRALCMKFWYHMFGVGMGSLKVIRVTKQHTNDEHPARKEFEAAKPLLKIEKNQGNKWHKAVVNLPFKSKMKRMNVNWIALVGTIGSSYRGDIGIDDIQFTQGRCADERN